MQFVTKSLISHMVTGVIHRLPVACIEKACSFYLNVFKCLGLLQSNIGKIHYIRSGTNNRINMPVFQQNDPKKNDLYLGKAHVSSDKSWAQASEAVTLLYRPAHRPVIAREFHFFPIVYFRFKCNKTLFLKFCLQHMHSLELKKKLFYFKGVGKHF